MHVQDLKRWHWVAISVFVGLLLSFAWSQAGNPERLSVSPPDFERGLIGQRNRVGAFIDITVFPASNGKNNVYGRLIRPTTVADKGDAQPYVLPADIPYPAGQWHGQPEKYADVMAYLAKMKKENPALSYRYAWWYETWALYLLWTSASVLLIGGVWPSVVSLMVGAGLGLEGEEKGPEYDLSRFKGEAQKQAGKKGATDADLQHLHDLEDELEKRLAAERAGMPMPADQPAQTAAAMKKLDGGPLENLAPDKPGEEHEYRGDFYPVDRGAKKKT